MLVCNIKAFKIFLKKRIFFLQLHVIQYKQINKLRNVTQNKVKITRGEINFKNYKFHLG